jgi:hypothetical protein
LKLLYRMLQGAFTSVDRVVFLVGPHNHRSQRAVAGVRSAILTAVSLALAACSSPTDAASLAGTYVMSIGTDTLRLDPSGRYARAFLVRAPDVVAVDTGRWSLSRNGRMVTLENLPRRWPEHGRFDPVQGWHAPDTTVRQTIALLVGTTWTGKTTLGVRPEIGWRYVRLASD